MPVCGKRLHLPTLEKNRLKWREPEPKADILKEMGHSAEESFDSKKIIFICHNGYAQPGSRIRCYDFSHHLSKLGFITEVLSYKDHLGASADGPDSWRIKPWEKIKLISKAVLRLIRQPADTVFYIQKSGYHAVAPLLIHFVRGNPLVLDYDDYECFAEGSLSNKLLKLIAKNSELTVAASRELQELLTPMSQKVIYVPCGADPELFSCLPDARANKSKVFCWTGTVYSDEIEANLLKLMNVFTESAPEFKLKVLGESERIQKAKDYAASRGYQNIEFTGFLDPKELPVFLTKADFGFIVLDDTPYDRCKSLVRLYDFLASGAIPIVSDVGEAGSIITDGVNGFKFKDWSLLSNLLINLSQYEESILEKTRENARQLIEKSYSMEVLMRQLAGHLRTVGSELSARTQAA